MRESLSDWEPPETTPGGVPFGPERVAAVNTVKCPKCGAEPMRMCVYVQVPIPRGYYNQDSAAWKRYRKSGETAKVPHGERTAALRLRRVREARKAERKGRQAQQLAVRPSEELLAAAHAMRQYDFSEHRRLAWWVRAYGDILVSAGDPV
jgi:hypothetical protein